MMKNLFFRIDGPPGPVVPKSPNPQGPRALPWAIGLLPLRGGVPFIVFPQGVTLGYMNFAPAGRTPKNAMPYRALQKTLYPLRGGPKNIVPHVSRAFRYIG